ncbi:thioesterase II family protein [Streptomyces radicis]|uniref:Thioesterase n=1 Tax=Streptomyces radicis TaxID=1750517 RepID=A0A3A9VX49_9ACTN|nr:thioesterase domain-containing protein [Streptomyces radicis]RKN05082.1 thioesterase [Streptomyces radicis]RKN16408.1 thioesterase [Streptomyces radicis]
MTARASRWLPFPVAAGAPRLYCLPHAGGSASAFRPWLGRLGGVAVCPVQPPGRETRPDDAPPASMAALCADLADRVIAETDGPYAVFGHSLGALTGFELIRAIRERGGPLPEHLVVSGCSAPQTLTGDAEGLTDEQVLGLMRGLGGTPESFLDDPRVVRMILPRVRADLAVRNSFRYAPGPPLDVPITALAADDDPRADVASVAAWRDQTISRFRLHTYRGGHFAVLAQEDRTLAHLRTALAPWLPAPTAAAPV